jgi:hypothetical protein
VRRAAAPASPAKSVELDPVLSAVNKATMYIAGNESLNRLKSGFWGLFAGALMGGRWGVFSFF